MKIKDDVIERFEKGATVWEIATLYNTSVGAVLDLLGTERSHLAEDALQWWIEQENIKDSPYQKDLFGDDDED